MNTINYTTEKISTEAESLKRPQALRLNICVKEPLPKENSEKDTENAGNNLYHTQNLIFAK